MRHDVVRFHRTPLLPPFLLARKINLLLVITTYSGPKRRLGRPTPPLPCCPVARPLACQCPAHSDSSPAVMTHSSFLRHQQKEGKSDRPKILPLSRTLREVALPSASCPIISLRHSEQSKTDQPHTLAVATCWPSRTKMFLNQIGVTMPGGAATHSHKISD